MISYKPVFVISSIFGICISLFSSNASATPDPVLDAMVAGIQSTQTAMEVYQKAMDTKYMLQNFKNYGWGANGYLDHSSYGAGAEDWTSVLNTAQSGTSAGVLGQTIEQLAKQFPITQNTTDYNSAVSNPEQQKYYAMQAQTALAARASSELDYNNVKDQLDYENKLRADIDKTQSTKEALDLMNRIQVESNLIHLETLRQQSLANQQKALDSQGEVNAAALNAHFLKPTE